MRVFAFLLLILTVLATGVRADVVAARTLPAGTVLSRGDLAISEAAGRDGADLQALLGLETRRAVYRGQPLRRQDVGPPTLVERNAIVIVFYRVGGLVMRVEGRALDAGGKGDRIRVLNLASHATLQTTVAAPSVVEVRQ